MEINDYEAMREIEKIRDSIEDINTSIRDMKGDMESPQYLGDASREMNELMGALAKAQAEMKIAGKSSNNPFFKSKYADLASVVEASRPYLAKNGLCVLQRMWIDEDGNKKLTTILGHSSGQYITSVVRLNPAKDDVQSLGSFITYMRRYSYASLVGVVADEEDDDGEGTMKSVRYPSSSSSNGNHAIPEKISDDQCNILIRAIGNNVELAENILRHFKLKSLRDVPRNRFEEIYDRVVKINQDSSPK